MLKRVTVEDIMDRDPCSENYDRSRVEKLFGKRKTMNALNIAKLDIPYFDILWAILNTGMIPEHIIRTFICDCAKHVLHHVPGQKRRTVRALIERTAMMYDDGGKLLGKYTITARTRVVYNG